MWKRSIGGTTRNGRIERNDVVARIHNNIRFIYRAATSAAHGSLNIHSLIANCDQTAEFKNAYDGIAHLHLICDWPIFVYYASWPYF